MENKQIFLMTAIIIAFGLGAAILVVPTGQTEAKTFNPGQPNCSSNPGQAHGEPLTNPTAAANCRV
jgi:hypothetical protein